MPRVNDFLRYWLPVILWMMVIFTASTGLGSAQKPSRFIGPFLRWVYPEITSKQIETVRFYSRKAGHALEYALLAVLIFRALPPRVTPWQPTRIASVVALSGFYAVTDEVHQIFVPGRQGSILDVIIDIAGAALGLGLLWIITKFRKRA